jgi:8-oxo-dGTP pyrophosphatase MutT (NUDIX family)
VNAVAGPIRSLQAQILAQARVAPPADAVALVIARQACGSLAPVVAATLAREVEGLSLSDGFLELQDAGLDAQARSLRLQQIARLLLSHGLSAAWRDEDLDIRAEPDAPALARIDRSAVRVLGITTYSVHLNGYTSEGQLVVAQRAAHKRVDPGMWDNLAGGMIAAGEEAHAALHREAFEEAGIRLADMAVQPGARITVRRPIAEGTLAETVQVFDVDLPPGTVVANQDGEVARFETRPVAAVVAAIAAGEFSTEAALATLDSLIRRGYDRRPG